MPDETTDWDEDFSRAMGALSSPTRLAILRSLRQPRGLRDIRVESRAEEGEARAISRQAVRRHLDRLVEAGFVVAREADIGYGPTTEYSLNHQAIFAMAEEVRDLARLRPAADPGGETIVGGRTVRPPRDGGPWLVLVRGLEEGRRFDVTPPPDGEAEWVIGRRREADVPLDFDPYVSSENALVEWEPQSNGDDGDHYLRDLGSRNGTLLNFEPLATGGRRALEPGDVIGVGRSLLVYQW